MTVESGGWLGVGSEDEDSGGRSNLVVGRMVSSIGGVDFSAQSPLLNTRWHRICLFTTKSWWCHVRHGFDDGDHGSKHMVLVFLRSPHYPNTRWHPNLLCLTTKAGDAML